MSQVTCLEDAPFIDLSDPSLSVRSQPIKDVRAQSWFARTPYGIAVLRYADMRNLLLHRSLRQGSHEWPAYNNVSGVFSDWWSRTILVQEGADHERLRRLVNPAFSPSIISAMKPDFAALAKELVDGFAGSGSCDFMADFADPYASRVICHVLGLPRDEADRVLKLSATMGLALGLSFKENEVRINEATVGMYAYADELVANRRNDPGDDFMSNLVAASEGGDRLSDQELRDMILMLVFAGIDTTRNQLGLGMATFLDHPDQWHLLAERPELAAQAVEEVMRVRPTITWVTRQAIKDFEYNGLTIKKGTTLHLLAEAAGTDEAVYDADFDITAERKRHFGFGGGMHHCLGHAIARSDMAIALEVLPPKLRNVRSAGPGEWLPDSGNTGAISLPIAFDPAQ
ncbi:MAG: cytochrome P450 [Pseudomonadota bacterium]